MALDPDIFKQLEDTVARVVRERWIPLEDDVEETGEVSQDVIDEMKEMGLFGLTIPEEYGGLGLNTEEEARLMFEVGKAAPAFRSVFGTTIGIGSQGIVMDGTDEQKSNYLPKLASGEIVGSFCLTEPNAGSDAKSLQTTAILDGNEYVLNGTKRYITNAPRAGLYTVYARTNPEDKGAGGVSAILVEAGTKGQSTGKIDKKMGQKGTQTSDLVFEDCRVPATQLLGLEEGMGFKTAMKVLDRGRLHLAAACVGMARRLIDDALAYAMERKQFGEPIANFQLVQAMLADSETELYAARTMTLDACKRRDAGEKTTRVAACAKYYATEMVGRVADRAVQIHGGAGYIAEYKVERFYRDVRLFRLYEGTSQIQQLIIARDMIKSAS
ncbi:acyl-CoA dehydrogenase family protein [Alphaproteobacteria bacterium]|jgi:acyl-CoA dehydrogenase|nr:acyl-CoA dehydrogenase family protein [Alphaproteobacteria bacterium]